MTATDITGSSQVAVAATSSATSAPSASTDGFRLPSDQPGYRLVRTLIKYSGTVDAANVVMWIRDGSGDWYRGASTDALDPLSPGGASPVNEARDWDVRNASQVFFQVGAVSGGGTVAIRVVGLS